MAGETNKVNWKKTVVTEKSRNKTVVHFGGF